MKTTHTNEANEQTKKSYPTHGKGSLSKGASPAIDHESRRTGILDAVPTISNSTPLYVLNCCTSKLFHYTKCRCTLHVNLLHVYVYVVTDI